MKKYRLNLNQQPNGDYEVHEEGCEFWPKDNYDDLGNYSNCFDAVAEAKKRYPSKHRINGCKPCSEPCHTT